MNFKESYEQRIDEESKKKLAQFYEDRLEARILNKPTESTIQATINDLESQLIKVDDNSLSIEEKQNTLQNVIALSKFLQEMVVDYSEYQSEELEEINPSDGFEYEFNFEFES